MRTFLKFLGLLAGALLVAAVLAWPAWQLVALVSVEPFHRVMHRVAMLIGLIGLVVLVRRLGLADRTSLGYGLPRPVFLKQLSIGFGAGVAMMVPLIVLLYGLDLRLPKEGFEWGGARLFGAIAGGLLSGAAVALIEETFFRGAMQTGIERESGQRLAIVLPSLLYASLHFLGGKLRVPAEEASWASGIDVLANLFERYAHPLELVDSFMALLAVGVLLAIVRARTGAIAACLGLHAAWVCVISVLREASMRNPQAEWSWLVGSYDGVIGWLAFAWTLGVVVVALRWLPKAPGRVALRTQ
jgi:membrane protease YdiL (CAAX protease family)